METNNEFSANELLEWTSIEALRHIHDGSVSAERYASQLLKRYNECKDLNAIISIDENRMLQSARAVDVARSAGKPLAPLAGLPIVIKDNINTAGVTTTAGSGALKGYVPQRNARVAQILFDNGAILMAKANLDELGREFTNSNQIFGFAKNPYDPTRVPGGGAGGTAVAIAARMTPAGLGSDTAGSARIPASFSGVAGLRPSTAGRLRGWTTGSWTVSTREDGLIPISYAISTPGPMGRTVSDVALLNAIVTGTRVPVALPLRGERIGIPRGYFWEDIDPEVARVSELALKKLREAGAQLVDVDLRQWGQTASPNFLVLATLNGMNDLGDFLARNGAPATLTQVLDALKDGDIRFRTQQIQANPVTPQQAEAAVAARIQLGLQYEELFQRERLSAILFPTVPVLAPPIRPYGDEPTDTLPLNGKQVPQFDTSMRNTQSASVVGIPALNIPAGLSASGLPVGLSLAGLADSETQLLGLALSVEAAFGRLPAPNLKLASAQAVSANTAPASIPIAIASGGPVAAAPASMPGAGDSADRVLALLKQCAYVNLYGSVEVAALERSGSFAAKARLRRYDIDFRINRCGPGMRALNLIGQQSVTATLQWSFTVNGAASNFTMDDVLVFDDEGRNQLRARGSGQMAPPESSGRQPISAQANIRQGTGIFAGVQAGYVVSGSREGSRLNLYLSLRLMDPSGNFQARSSLPSLEGTKPDEPRVTSLAFLGEPDPANPVQKTPTGATVHELLRAVHTDFDRGRRSESLHAATTLGPIVARWRTDVLFNPADPSNPGTADKPMPVKLPNINIALVNGAGGTLQASITDGAGFVMRLPGVSGPQFRMTGFGPIGTGTGWFQNARGTILMLGAIDLVPAAFSNLYILHLVDTDGRFRC